MQAARRIHHARDLARLQGKCGLLELALHVAPAEVTQVTPLAGAAAVRLGDGQVAERDLAAPDALLVGLDDGVGLVLVASDV